MALTIAGYYLWAGFQAADQWSSAELDQINSIWIENLPESPPADPTNLVADRKEARTLGHHLFFDERLSSNGEVSCATCHDPNLAFTDGLKTSRAIGISSRNAPSLIGVSYSPWLYWDGRKDSQWSQALSPLEDQAEHGGNRMFYAKLILNDPDYRRSYKAIFGKTPDINDDERFPDMYGPFKTPENKALWSGMAKSDQFTINEVFANLGKALAAYQRLLKPGVSRFDDYVKSLNSNQRDTSPNILTSQEKLGLNLFIGKANCTNCHNGPLLANNAFHNTGLLSSPGKLPDLGRKKGIDLVRQDPFNCLNAFSDDNNACMELLYASSTKELVGSFRTPSLRNLKLTAPYGHAGQQQSLAEVLDHYNEAPDAMIGHNEAKPLELWPWELWQLEAFLETLDAPPKIEGKWLVPPKKNS